MSPELAVVGTGPAGMTAGLYAGRFGLETTLFERSEFGGELVNRHAVADYPGVPDDLAGAELRSRFVEQLRAYDLDLELSGVTALEADADGARLEASGVRHDADAVVIATGARQKTPPWPGAERLSGAGVFECAVCDGPLYQDEQVAVVGGGERAFADARYLAEFASSVLLVETRPETPTTPATRSAIADDPDVTVRTDATIASIDGDDIVTGLTLRDCEGRASCEPVDGVLVRVGREPNVEFLPDAVETTAAGAVAADANCSTSLPGVFAAGAVRDGPTTDVAGAVGDGERAFRAAFEYLW
jgi:thioredoxin reductase (NADPH)